MEDNSNTNSDLENKDTNQNEETKKEPGFFAELFRFGLIVALIVVPFRLFIAQPFIVEGASMDPTFHNGQYLIVDQLSYHFGEPQRGDVLIFKYPKDPSQFYIKRVIGLPGETVDVTDGNVRIYNDQYPAGLQIDEPYVEHNNVKNTVTELSDDEYFVMGDNRKVSSDSRFWGAVPKENIIGKPILRLLPVSNIDFYPGDYNNY